MNREELAWAAGFFDGEGTFCFTAASATTAAVTQVYRPSLVRFQRSVRGLGTIKGPKIRGNWQPQYEWFTTSFQNTQAVAAMLWPWLGEPKREQICQTLAKAAASRKRHRAHLKTSYIHMNQAREEKRLRGVR